MRPYVLVVDDDEDTRDAIRDVLTVEGYAVQCACDGEVALSLLELGRPDLLIVDLMMPRMNGWELLAHLQEHPGLESVAILVLTADRSSCDLGLDSGVSACLDKPVDLEALLIVVASLVGGGSTP